MSLNFPLPDDDNDVTPNFTIFPRELNLNILTFLRATDLSALQRTSKTFNDRSLIAAVVDHCANVVYPSDLTNGFDSPIVGGEVRSVDVAAKKGNNKKNFVSCVSSSTSTTLSTTTFPEEKVYTYEMLRNMEMLVVARVLSRPEPPIQERSNCFYVSKSWCRAALRWLEVQEEERKEQEERRRAAQEAKLLLSASAAAMTPGKGRGKGGGKQSKNQAFGSSGKKKISRKEQKQRERRMSDSMPPWSNINVDIVCEHGSVKQCSTKSARARRRVMDKQAWKVLKRLYPDSVQLDAASVGCLLCTVESETAKKAENDKKEEEKANRKKPLACPLVRGFYTRGSKGFPMNCIVPPKPLPFLSTTDCKQQFLGQGIPFKPAFAEHSICPLKPGVYCALPRSWCHRWRKYIKSGEGGLPPPPDASELLCEAHDLPLIPPHLESFLRGETSTLLGVNPTPASNTMDVGLPIFPVGSVMAASVGSAYSSTTTTTITSSNIATLQALRAAGLSESELYSQRIAMECMEEDIRRYSIHEIQHHHHQPPQGEIEREPSSGSQQQQQQQQDRAIMNEQLDRENFMVVEILTEDEITALEKNWPRCHGGTYALRFAVVEEFEECSNGNATTVEIVWATLPCRECDPSSRLNTDFVIRNRLQKRGCCKN